MSWLLNFARVLALGVVTIAVVFQLTTALMLPGYPMPTTIEGLERAVLSSLTVSAVFSTLPLTLAYAVIRFTCQGFRFTLTARLVAGVVTGLLASAFFGSLFLFMRLIIAPVFVGALTVCLITPGGWLARRDVA